jgi:hypothetical protein
VAELSDDTDKLQPFFFDTAEIHGYTNLDLMGGLPDAEHWFGLLGRDLVTKPIVQTPTFSVFHESAKPGEQVKPHRHGVLQVDYVLKGELWFGNRCIKPGMGAFIPDTLYAWRAGDEGAEWIEIHSGGESGLYEERRADE